MKKYHVLKEILLTEKSGSLVENQQYVFVVDAGANKFQIAEAVETIFKVKVARVNVANMPGKAKRVRSRKTNAYSIVGAKKKAIVSLKDGYKIDIA